MQGKYFKPGRFLSALALVPMLVLAACGGPEAATPTPTATQSLPASTAPSGKETATNAAVGDNTTATALPTGASGEKLQVVATTLQIRSLTESVAGDRAEVRSILTPGADAHEFEPRPSDIQAIAASDIVLRNGIGLDGWVDKLIENAGGQRPLVTVTGGIPLREGGHDDDEDDDHETEAEGTKEADEHDDGDDDEEDHDEEGNDPHVWLDVTNAMTMTRNIRDALIQVDPAGAAIYNANTDAALTRLIELDNYIEAQIALIPEGQRKMVTNHDAFGYFIARYNLQYVGSIIPSLSTEAQPSAGDVAALIEKLKSENVKAIFLESSINPQLAQQIANDTGVKLVDNLYADSMGAPGTPGETYEGMMRHNADTIVNALK